MAVIAQDRLCCSNKVPFPSMVWRLLAWTVLVVGRLIRCVTDPFVLVHAYSDLLGAMLTAKLSCVVWWSAW